MSIVSEPSPHFSERSMEISAIVIHDTGGGSAESTLSWFKDPESKVSSHYLIGKDGAIYQCVDDGDEAWHAGQSILHGTPNVNEFSIGIELVDQDDSEPYPHEQISALINLTSALCYSYKIPLNRIVGHCHVAAGRKTDPGKDFPWFEFLNIIGAKVSNLIFEAEDNQ